MRRRISVLLAVVLGLASTFTVLALGDSEAGADDVVQTFACFSPLTNQYSTFPVPESGEGSPNPIAPGGTTTFSSLDVTFAVPKSLVVAGIGAGVVDFVTDPALFGSFGGVNAVTNRNTTARFTVANDTVAGITTTTGSANGTFFVVYDGVNSSSLQIYVEDSPGSWDGSGTDGLHVVPAVPIVIALSPDIVATSDGTENDLMLSIAQGPFPANPAGAPTILERNAAPLVLLNDLSGLFANFYCWPGTSQGAIDSVTGLPGPSAGFTPGTSVPIDTVVVEAGVTTTTGGPTTTTLPPITTTSTTTPGTPSSAFACYSPLTNQYSTFPLPVSGEGSPNPIAPGGTTTFGSLDVTFSINPNLVDAGIGAGVLDFVTTPQEIGSIDPETGGDGVNSVTSNTTARFTVTNDTVAGTTATSGKPTVTFFVVYNGVNSSSLQIYVQDSPGSWDGSGSDGLHVVPAVPIVIALSPDIVATSDGTENDMTLAIAQAPFPAAGRPTLAERNAAPLVLLNSLGGLAANFYCWPGTSQGAIDPVTGLPGPSAGLRPGTPVAIDTVVVEAGVTTTTTVAPPTTTTTTTTRPPTTTTSTTRPPPAPYSNATLTVLSATLEPVQQWPGDYYNRWVIIRFELRCDPAIINAMVKVALSLTQGNADADGRAGGAPWVGCGAYGAPMTGSAGLLSEASSREGLVHPGPATLQWRGSIYYICADDGTPIPWPGDFCITDSGTQTVPIRIEPAS